MQLNDGGYNTENLLMRDTYTLTINCIEVSVKEYTSFQQSRLTMLTYVLLFLLCNVFVYMLLKYQVNLNFCIEFRIHFGMSWWSTHWNEMVFGIR